MQRIKQLRYAIAVGVALVGILTAAVMTLAGGAMRAAEALDWSVIVTDNAITSVAYNGDAYQTGETVTITVTFNKPVRVLSTAPPHEETQWPELEIEIGDTNRRARYTDQSINANGHTEHHWSYTVVAADRDVDGISMRKDAIKAPHAVFVGNGYRGSGNIDDYTVSTELDRSIYDPLVHRVGNNLPLLPPDNFEVSYRFNGVDLTWDARFGATKYVIYRATPDALHYTYQRKHTVVGGGGTGWRDTDVTRGRPYAYKIATVNRNGTGPQSPPQSITLPPP